MRSRQSAVVRARREPVGECGLATALMGECEQIDRDPAGQHAPISDDPVVLAVRMQQPARQGKEVPAADELVERKLRRYESPRRAGQPIARREGSPRLTRHAQ